MCSRSIMREQEGGQGRRGDERQGAWLRSDARPNRWMKNGMYSRMRSPSRAILEEWCLTARRERFSLASIALQLGTCGRGGGREGVGNPKEVSPLRPIN